jgi:formylglycine-generating enzyme required for sulfatase activity
MYHYLSLLLIIFLSLTALTPADAASRLALVIGNGTYQKAPFLNNPIYDANDMALQLRKLGFQVILKHNQSKHAMTLALQYFKRRLRHQGGIGLFYFSGYGVQLNGQNFLLPVDASIKTEGDIPKESLNANTVIAQMKQANNGINIIILDASRDYSYKTNLKNLKKGLAKMESPTGFLIAYANAPNTVSYGHSRERNSTYTKYLLEALRYKPHLDIFELLTEVKRKVVAISRRTQMPWASTSLTQQFCFRKCTSPWQPPLPEVLQPSKPQVSQPTIPQPTKLEISQILRTCEKHIQAYRLTSGEGGTALACYKEVLKKDPNNAEALEGLDKIEAKYVELIEYALSRGQEQKVQQYMAGLRKVKPESPKLAAFEEKMQPPVSTPQAVTPVSTPQTVTPVSTPQTVTPVSTPQAVTPVSTPEPVTRICPAVVTDKVFRDCFLEENSLGPEMVWIPSGSFRMGDLKGNGNSDEKPVHTVTIKSFAMGRYEVTFAEYDKFVKATNRIKPSDYGWGRGKRPVIDISWEDATAYAQWLSQQTGKKYRLPTEAEWEYAARAGTETVRYWGNDPDVACRYANVYDKSKRRDGLSWTRHDCTDGYANTAPVGHFKPNAFGLFDMLGNVWEWTCSLYEREYSGEEKKCLNNASHFSLRGGGWDSEPARIRSAFRDMGSPSYRYEYVGFRLVRQ